MLLPFDFAVLSIEDAKLLLKYIEESITTNGRRDYKKLREAGINELYERLGEFVGAATHYREELRWFDSEYYQRKSYD